MTVDMSGSVRRTERRVEYRAGQLCLSPSQAAPPDYRDGVLHLPARPPAATPDEAEAARLVALRRYGTADMPGEQELAGLVRVAATLASVPTATINLLEEAEQHNYVTYGLDVGSCPREDSMCVVALRERGPLHVPDASVDPRFTTNPWVDGRLGAIRRYASSPLMTPDGWMIGTLCVFDERPGAFPAPVLQALDDLAAQVMALLERRRLARRAEEAVRAKATFLATISHEIRTPMHGVLGLLELVLQEQLPVTARTNAELARRSANALLTLVDDVLHLSQGEAGHITLQPRDVDPAQLVADVGDALRVLAQRKSLGLVVRTHGEPGAVVGDPDRIRQVLVNLVGNAVKFSADGDVALELHSAPRPDGDVDLTIAVRDRGEGIPPEELPTLFTPFAQGRSGHRHGGTGLGLAICAQIVETMGGRIEVDSALGVGSTFTVHLRLPSAAGPTTTHDEDRSCAGLRVLVADDSEINRLVAVGLLGSLGADAEAVADGERAVAQAAAGGYDVVLLDHEMPGLDGPAAARRIRRLPRPLCDVPLYALTGRVGNEDVAACLEAGMDGVLAKPLDVTALAAALAGVPRR
jgi:signal transduction histidine kinase